MPCSKCGCAVGPPETEPADSEGYFSEEYECTQGHKGWVRGNENEPPQQWNRYGAVFDG